MSRLPDHRCRNQRGFASILLTLLDKYYHCKQLMAALGATNVTSNPDRGDDMRPFILASAACLLATTAIADDKKTQEQVRADLAAISSYCKANPKERILRRHECRRLVRAAVSRLETFEGVELGDQDVSVVPAAARK